MEKDGFSVDDVFSQSVFQKDERDMVLKAVHVVQPDYQPSQRETLSQCSSPLVHHFYTQVSVQGDTAWGQMSDQTISPSGPAQILAFTVAFFLYVFEKKESFFKKLTVVFFFPQRFYIMQNIYIILRFFFSFLNVSPACWLNLEMREFVSCYLIHHWDSVCVCVVEIMALEPLQGQWVR